MATKAKPAKKTATPVKKATKQPAAPAKPSPPKPKKAELPTPELGVGLHYQVTAKKGGRTVYGEAIETGKLHVWSEGRPAGEVYDLASGDEANQIERERAFELSHSHL